MKSDFFCITADYVLFYIFKYPKVNCYTNGVFTGTDITDLLHIRIKDKMQVQF